MPEPFSAERLAQLKTRLDRDPTSRVFLQLAEEYRRAGRLGEAIQVLDAGVKIHPAYVAAQVVLGRTLLESGDAVRAGAALERAVELDQTQLVANRLLVEAHLALGETRKARERLELYRLLNDRDAEIDRLDERIRELGGPPGAGSARRRPAARPAATPAEPLFSLPEPPELPAIPLAAFVLSRQPRAPSRAEQPFGAIRVPGAGSRAVSARAGVSIFEIRSRRRFQPTLAPSAAPPALAPPLFPVSLARHGATAVWETASPTHDSIPERLEESPGTATTTLGELYLSQGHFADAEESFETVLEARPTDAAALAGLAEVRRRREEAEAAFFDESAGQPEVPMSVASAVGGLSSRKVLLLRDFLNRIRKGSASHVS